MGRQPDIDIRLIRFPGLAGSGLTRFADTDSPVARHAHESLIVGTVEAGSRTFAIENDTITAGPGSVFAIPPGAVHAVSHPDGKCSGLAVHCTPEDLVELLGSVPVIRLFATQDHLLRSRLTAVVEALECDLPAMEQQGRLVEALARVQERYSAEAPAPRKSHAGAAKAKALMVERFHEPLTLADLAEAAGMNACALGRAFSASMGMPPHEFLTFVRVRNARLLLERGDTIANVAASCGFSDQSHMHRAFRAVLGMTPGQYVDACKR